MLRWLYIQLLRAHPYEFRCRFADEMLEGFDDSRGLAEPCWLLFDGLVSLLRQWFMRPEFHRPWQPVTGPLPAYELLTFHQLEPYKPRGIALAQGGVMALLLLIGVVNAINHGGGKVRTLLIGMHRPGRGLIRLNRAAFEGGPLSTTVDNGRDTSDPSRPFAYSYFRIIRVLSALDRDGNLLITPAEMMDAPAALLRLDLDHDGKLSAEECGFLPPGDFDQKVDRIGRYRAGFMRQNPVLAALDIDHDGEISEAEIANSPIALQSLDFNHDGKLTAYEVMPSQALSQAAALMTRFDTYDSGALALEDLTSEDGDTTAIRRILIAADRNHDGVVTRGELIVELAGSTAVPAPSTFRSLN